MKFYRRYFEKGIEKILMACSLVSGLLVIFIIFFLFKEGIGLFNKSVVDENYILAVNPQNPVNALSSKEISLIFNQDVTNWKEVGGNNDTIILFTINDIGNYFTEEDLGADFEHMPRKIDELVQKTTSIIAFMPKSNINDDFNGKKIEVKRISLPDFLTGKDWYPTSEPAPQFGVMPLILGTLLVSIVAILISLPIGLITAVYMAEVASARFRNFLKPVIELLAGIPSVVYGFFGLVVVVPLIQETFGLAVGETALTGSIILAIMALPTIITISEDALRTTPKALKEASLALGANTLQTLTRVTIPYAKSGITAAAILGIGRAVGETMAVLMVTGNASVIPTSVLQPVRTIPATIAAELGEAPFGGVHFKALFTLGIILFLFTMTFNFIVDMVKNRNKSI
jgi:phosphate transport system permease protein